MQKQVQLSCTGNNHFELAIAIKQHLTIGIIRQMNPQSRPEPLTNVKNKPEACNTVQNYQWPLKPASTMQQQQQLF